LRKLKKGSDLLERKVKQRTQKLREAIALKDVYLAETHHRVKNNLQIISSLLDLQAAHMQDEQVRAEFNVSKIRIETINLIHQRLFHRQDVQSIDFKEFLVELFRLIERSQVDSERDLLLEITGDELDVRQREGIPLGMIFNEFITNTIKHVVPKQPVTRVSISIERRTDNQVLLIYDDFGPGLPDGIPFEKMESLGLRLVGGFVRQLKGSVTIDSKVSSRVLISFRLTE
jgi:two-component sensor histidine kinase